MMQVYKYGNIQQPVIVISPGWQMNDHGKPGTLHGDSECPEDMHFQPGCTIIHPKDKTVSVSISTPEATKKEIWTVEQKGKYPGEIIYLKRPDNTYVTSWEKKQ
ncbi:hypothetical protein [Buttiauxella sp. 3AFRM03]|uniref:hypothetical protein n=1 Tax=Buttiauxella sp. 3AFRM03 TaxID=2479367 RepID=UPI0013900343|nr:hypothetical protein [Buttiauxella sp. 3AFRM03]